MKLRNGRRWLTAKATYAARTLAPSLPAQAIDIVETQLARIAPALPRLGRIVEANLRAAGIDQPDVVRDYFAQAVRQLANTLRLFRLQPNADAIVRLARRQSELDPSIASIRRAIDGRTGMILAAAHVCDYPLWLVRLNQEVPLSVYLRWSKDARRRDVKRDWARAAGLMTIVEPPHDADATHGALACARFLRQGGALFLTPDIVQKAGRGVAVNLFGRQVCLPAGAAMLARLTGAPLVPVFGRTVDGRQVIYAGEPIRVAGRRGQSRERAARIQQATQEWANQFEAFVRDCPQAWFFWGDKRWTRVFQGDPRYTETSGTPRIATETDGTDPGGAS